MYIYPAIDLFGQKAVRLYQGDYGQMTTYGDDPVAIASAFASCGATHIHLVDLEGAKSGTTPNLDMICKIKKAGSAFCEVGGGIRSMEVIDRYLSAGLDRVILGTAAVTDAAFLETAVQKYGKQIAVGVDIKDGFVAVNGWTKQSDIDAFSFCEKLQQMGVGTLICTDITKDGAMAGTNHALYAQLNHRFSMQIIASGGVSSIEDVRRLAALGLHGAIIGKAYYTGAIDLKEAIEVAE